tara:strand:- start:600 stop:716 length:117 start_codon:yes stop_codon:yes gene_type:complete
MQGMPGGGMQGIMQMMMQDMMRGGPPGAKGKNERVEVI